MQIARYTLPPLTSVRMSRLDLAGAAVEALRSLIEGKSSRRSVQPAVATELVVRRSTSIPRESLFDLKERSTATASKRAKRVDLWIMRA
ncbi:MAG: substrate-binding domain-containing protein [Acidobacteria bacterium]|nr:substrate-binding domain-containing protein [Acidobacteriota bacterium]